MLGFAFSVVIIACAISDSLERLVNHAAELLFGGAVDAESVLLSLLLVMFCMMLWVLVAFVVCLKICTLLLYRRVCAVGGVAFSMLITFESYYIVVILPRFSPYMSTGRSSFSTRDQSHASSQWGFSETDSRVTILELVYRSCMTEFLYLSIAISIVYSLNLVLSIILLLKNSRQKKKT
ncbi:MAG: hypothetical protein H0U27_12355 [Nitrosopumilus sp.]|nr:hypothetical protein [Nitrosopumilus sp.]